MADKCPSDMTISEEVQDVIAKVEVQAKDLVDAAVTQGKASLGKIEALILKVWNAAKS